MDKYSLKGLGIFMDNNTAFIYEWTNTINGKKYIGGHIGKETDKYIGSGVFFRKDLKKYGTDAFERKILEYTTPEKVKERESYYLEAVNARDNPLYYNKANSSSITKFKTVEKIRPICSVCGRTPAAVNYRTPDGIVHYRTRCDNCIRKKKGIKVPQPQWMLAGYKKKPHCEKCGFKFKYKEQSFVYHVDGNLNNTALLNLKTVCANCQIEIAKSGLGWAQGDLVPDY